MHHAFGLILPSTSLHDPASMVPLAGMKDLHIPHICP